MTWFVIAVFAVSVTWWVAQGIFFLRARTGVHRIGTLPLETRTAWPKLSLVMPARNEAAHLEAALASKIASTYPNLELVLVDDRSTDETGAIADRFATKDPRLKVVHLHELPPGWLGKVHAMAKGFDACTGAFVLFSDADIVIEPGTLERAVAEADRRQLDFLTIFPTMRLSGLLLTASLATMFRILVLFTRPWAVRDPRSSAYMGVGAFNLVRRAALAKTKGLEWLRMETGDDVTLGWMMKRSGAACDVFLGGRDVHLEFYPSFGTMMRAVEKNGASAPFPALVLASLAMVTCELGYALGFALGGPFLVAACLIFVGSALLNLTIGRWMGYPTWTSPIASLGVLPFSFVMVRSATLALVRGGVTWRGTFYPTKVVAESRRLFNTRS
ncbi:MAG: glycosyltransferase family 2 protein [Myxococcaceae bacterium]